MGLILHPLLRPFLAQGQWVAAGHSALSCRLSEAESYSVARLPGAGIWLLGGKRTWAQSQPWEGVPAQLGCLGLANKGRHTRSQTDRQTDTQPVFAPFGKEAPKMLHTYSHSCTHCLVFLLLTRMVHGHRHTPYIQIPLCAHCAPQEPLSSVFLYFHPSCHLSWKYSSLSVCVLFIFPSSCFWNPLIPFFAHIFCSPSCMFLSVIFFFQLYFTIKFPFLFSHLYP